ncbi:MAG: hypothetical protein ACXWQO_01860 [Bdellovibrionota bacterium]
MKSVLIFLMGVFTSVIIVVATGFIFYYSKSTPEGIRAEVPSVSGAAIVPRPLQDEMKNGTGRVRVSLFKNNDKGVVPLGFMEVFKPSFPFRFTLPLKPEITAKDLEQNPGDHFPPLFNLRVTYFFSESIGSAGPDVRYAEANTIVTKADLEKILLNHNEKIDAGNLYFTRYQAQKNLDQCLPGERLFSGQISPSSEFTKRFGKSKFALVVAPWMRSVKDLSVIPENLDRYLYSYRFLDFSSGPVEISIPLPDVPLATPPEFSIFVVECGPHDALATCAKSAFPRRALESKSIFRAVADKFVTPFCGMQNLKMYVYPMRFSGKPLRGAAPNPASPSSPAEYVEDGALL